MHSQMRKNRKFFALVLNIVAVPMFDIQYSVPPKALCNYEIDTMMNDLRLKIDDDSFLVSHHFV